MSNTNTTELYTTHAVEEMCTCSNIQQITTSIKHKTNTYEINANSTDVTLSISVILVTW